MQIAKQITTGVVAVFMFLCMSRPMQAQGTDPIAAIQQKLTEHFVPAKLAGNGEYPHRGLSADSAERRNDYVCHK